MSLELAEHEHSDSMAEGHVHSDTLGAGHVHATSAGELPADELTLTSITPASGELAGGTPLTLTGTGFIGIAFINFGAATLDSGFVVVDSQTITMPSPPAELAGPVLVSVVNTDDEAGNLPDGFTYT